MFSLGDGRHAPVMTADWDFTDDFKGNSTVKIQPMQSPPIQKYDLDSLQAAGKKLFLMTSSYAEFL